MKQAASTPPTPSYLLLRSRLARISVALIASACMLSPAAAQTATDASSYNEVNQLLKQGQAAQALTKADAYIAKNPRDPQMRFLRASILADQGKRTEATEAFTQLTRDYPELPEPYNNLAAIYAAQGQYDKAREALETALRLNPNYATAHENLGDIYARLAAQQYMRAGQFASASKGVQLKLEHVRQLFDGGLAKAPADTSSRSTARSPAQTSDAERKAAPQR